LDDLVNRFRALFEEKGLRPFSKRDQDNLAKSINQLLVDLTEFERQHKKLRQAHDKLVKARDFYSDLFNLLPMGVMLLDHGRRVQKSNPAAARILRFDVFKKDIPLSSFVHGESRTVLQNHYKAVAHTETGQSCEVRLNYKRLAELILQFHSVPLAIDSDKLGFLTVLMDITAKVESEETLRIHNLELESRIAKLSYDLSEERGRRQQVEVDLKNQVTKLNECLTAMRVLLDNRHREKEVQQESVLANIQRLVMPLIEQLGQCGLNKEQKGLLELLETNLTQMTSGFAQRLGSIQFGLSPRELQVANLIKNGKTSDEIAEILFISPSSVLFHRNNIREKLGLKGQRIRLSTFLLNLP